MECPYVQQMAGLLFQPVYILVRFPILRPAQARRLINLTTIFPFLGIKHPAHLWRFIVGFTVTNVKSPFWVSVTSAWIVQVGSHIFICCSSYQWVLRLPDYDLCNGCFTNNGVQLHNPGHEFVDITTPGRVIIRTITSNNALHDESAQRSTTNVAHNATCDLCDARIQDHRYVSLGTV